MSTWTVSLRHLIALLGLAVQPILIAGAPRSNGVPRPDHVVVVIEENRSFDQIANTTTQPGIRIGHEEVVVQIKRFHSVGYCATRIHGRWFD